MRAYLLRADARLLLWSNAWLLQHPKWYQWALFATGVGFSIAFVLTVLVLWFWPEPLTVLDYAVEDVRPTQPARGGFAAPLRRIGRRLVGWCFAPLLRHDPITRLDSRARLLLCGIALLGGYVVVRLIGTDPHFQRPLESYLPVRLLADTQSRFVHHDATFASGHAMLLGAVPIFLGWNRSLGWLWIIAAAGLIAARVGLAFRAPLDMLAGACLGALLVWVPLLVYFRRGRLWAAVRTLAGYFDLSSSPYCYYLYFLAALVVIEVFAVQCDHLLAVIFGVRGSTLARLHP
jgi:membrane-associated phospholipid phosphatase